MRTEIPIYLFTGFLESGKTKFIQETLEDPRFSNGETTLVLVCEEGMEEYESEKFPQDGIYIKTIDDLSQITPDYLLRLQDELCFTRALVEYNGMWLIDDFYNSLPENWLVYQEMLFIDSASFESYNANMRSLVVDKLQNCELAVFNRFDKKYDKMQFHKIVRATNRSCDIAYEYADGNVEYDDIEDPLPFDVNAPIIKIEDRDYALWYRDTTEKLDEYDGKTVCFKACVRKDSHYSDLFVAGRDVMTCCIDDIKFAGFICESEKTKELSEGDWILITAKIEVKYHKVYKRKGPVFKAEIIEKTDAPQDPVATFY